jgi:pyridoxine 5'-phosphate synthase PdxJ
MKVFAKKHLLVLFVDSLINQNTNLDSIDYALKVKANTIEIHTGEFSKQIDNHNFIIMII